MFKIPILLSNTGILRSLAVAVLSIFAMAAQADDIDVTVGSHSISAVPTGSASSIAIHVGGPGGFRDEASSTDGSIIWYLPTGAADGNYNYDIYVTAEGTFDGDNPSTSSGIIHHGSFTVQGGSMSVPSADVVPGPEAAIKTDQAPSLMARLAKAVLDFLVPEAHAVDLFAISTNPRVNFEDTTDAGSGAVFDWLIWSDYGDGLGTGYFRVWDNGVGKNNILWLDQASAAGSTDQSLRVESDGDVGLADSAVFIDRSSGYLGIGTTSPVWNVHVASTNFPQIKMQETGTGDSATIQVSAGLLSLEGQTEQDVVQLALTAPQASIAVDAQGKVGMGTGLPGAALHVSKPTTAQILVQNTSTVSAERVPFILSNTGKTRFAIINSAHTWTFDNDSTFFNISYVGTGANEFVVQSSGNGYFRGNSYALVHVDTSSREVKKDFKDLDERDVLKKLASLPITEWRYKQDGSRHFGPVAEDFQATFGLGDGKHIATVDTAGVTMAAIQGLYQVVQDKEQEISALREEKNAELEALKAENRDLAERLKVLEKLILYKEVAMVQ